MRNLLALLLLMAFPAAAQTPEDMVAQFAGDSSLTRAVKAAHFCDGHLKNWRDPLYTQDIRRLGQLWSTHPEASYYYLDACQTTWSGQFLRPIQHRLAEKDASQSWLGPVINMLRSTGHLREEIYAFSLLKNDKNLPPAPFEILTGMASGQRQLNEILHQEMRANVRLLSTIAGGALAATLIKTKDMTAVVRTGTASVGRVFKYALVATILAWSAGEAVDYGLWKLRFSELNQRILKLEKALQSHSANRQVLLDEYFLAVKQMGYFLSFEVYLKESNLTGDQPAQPLKCARGLNSYYADRQLQLNSATCQDAAVFWAESARFLKNEFSNDAHAGFIAHRLEERALLTYMSYEAAWAYAAKQPICTPNLSQSNALKIEFTCVDPDTGAAIL